MIRLEAEVQAETAVQARDQRFVPGGDIGGGIRNTVVRQRISI
jgi:hypothetical protein